MYKNPIPCLPEDVKYKKFKIEFSYKDAMTVEEAAKKLIGKQFAQYCKDYGIAWRMKWKENILD